MLGREVAANFFHLRLSLSRQRRSRKEISQYSAAQTMSSILLLPYPEPIGPNDKSLSRNMSSQSVSYTVRLFLRSAAHWNCNKTCSSSYEQITCYEGKKLVNWFNLHQRCDQTLSVCRALRSACTTWRYAICSTRRVRVAYLTLCLCCLRNYIRLVSPLRHSQLQLDLYFLNFDDDETCIAVVHFQIAVLLADSVNISASNYSAIEMPRSKSLKTM